MINFVASEIERTIDDLRGKGVEVDKRGIQETPEGKFAWFIDPEGNKVELWEPSETHGQDSSTIS